ncbi:MULTISPECIES: hypothetical protein [Sporomusa]|uniref:hypothetical protein n=1 Tax=Sporomusa TaxID=2375 RepID=UPI003158D434
MKNTYISSVMEWRIPAITEFFLSCSKLQVPAGKAALTYFSAGGKIPQFPTVGILSLFGATNIFLIDYQTNSKHANAKLFMEYISLQ